MDSRVKHTYCQKQNFNAEYNVFRQFMSQNGFFVEQKIDTIILVDAKENEGDDAWKGLSQTMKVFISKELGKTNDKVAQLSDKMDDKFEQITSLIKSKSE